MYRLERMNMNGLSEAERSQRQSMLEYNQDKIIEAMRRVDFPDPVCIVADANNEYGKQLAIIGRMMGGASRQEATEEIEKQSREFARIGHYPTEIQIHPFGFAAEIMSMTSPTAAENMEKVRQSLETQTDVYLAIGMAGGGNSYQAVKIDGMKMPSDYRRKPKTAEDGQYRHTVTDYIRRQQWTNQKKNRNRPR